MRLIPVLSVGLMILLPASTFAGPAEDVLSAQPGSPVSAELGDGTELSTRC
jgi:hypothetical protein